MSESGHQHSQVRISNPQYNQRNAEKERPREMGNYVKLAHNSSTGPKGRANVENNRDCEEQRAHTEYVRLYIRCEMPRAAGPPNQTTIDDLIMLTPRPQMFTPRDQRFTPRAPMYPPRDALFTPRAPREPLIRQPDVTC